jgi:hypothetical protein
MNSGENTKAKVDHRQDEFTPQDSRSHHQGSSRADDEVAADLEGVYQDFDDGGSSITFGSSEADMSAFMSEILAARMQM